MNDPIQNLIGKTIPDGGRLVDEAPTPARELGDSFARALTDAVRSVEDIQDTSEAAQAAFAAGEPIELHEVLIRVEEADLAFTTLSTVRNKLIDAYNEILRMGSGG